MNKARRKELEKIIEELSNAQSALSHLTDEERDALDAMPDSLRESDKGMASEDAISNMEEAFDEIDATIERIREAMGN